MKTRTLNPHAPTREELALVLESCGVGHLSELAGDVFDRSHNSKDINMLGRHILSSSFQEHRLSPEDVDEIREFTQNHAKIRAKKSARAPFTPVIDQ